MANALVDSLDRIRSYSNIAWTYISPAFNFDINGPITGQYKIAGEEFALDQLIQTTISYADYATATTYILESNAHIRERIMVYR